jgi:hypothetical protein
MDGIVQGGDGAAAGVFEEALGVITGAQDAGIPVRLVGGLAVRFLTPAFPPRARDGQDLDLASISSQRRPLTEFLVARGYQPDKTFNALYGHKQLYFVSPGSGHVVDVLLDKLEMCHTLEFSDRIARMPYTLDPCDLLLSKLQIVHLNEKDAQDVIYLVSGVPVRDGDEPGTIGLGRFAKLLGEDWGWWRTVTLNLDKIIALAHGDGAHLLPPDPPHDAVEQLQALRRRADDAPKSLKWKLRAKVGERKRWYELPEETEHY